MPPADADSADPVEAVLTAVRQDRAHAAEHVLARHPDSVTNPLVAVVLGDVVAVARALAADPAWGTRSHGPEQWPPLLYAAASPFQRRDARAATAAARVVEQLIAHGASPGSAVRGAPGDEHAPLSALYFATSRGHVAAARILLEHGAAPNDGESVYHAAQFDQRECLELLYRHGAELSKAHPYWRNTPLYFLLGHREGDAGTDVSDRGIEWLLTHGADPNLTSGEQAETALHAAARSGRLAPMLEQLVTYGATVSATRRDGATPYALAVRHGHTRSAVALLALGAQDLELTPLDRFLAACHAADATAAAMWVAAEPELVRHHLHELQSALLEACARGSAGAIRLLLEAGVPVAAGSGPRATALHWAAWNGRPEAVRVLLVAGAPLDVRDDEYGSSPLAWCCHGSRGLRATDTDYVAVLDQLLDARPARAATINRWGEPPESLASAAVRARLAERGFIPEPGSG